MREGYDRFLISLAVLSLLAEAAEDRPLLCLIDDAHWLDPASSDALVFVGRRLEAEGIAMLFAVREHEGYGFEARGLPELALGGLDPQPAAALIGRRANVALSPEARQRLVAATGGNPLALLELHEVLSEAQLAGAEPMLTPLPVSERIERAFLARVHQLPEDTQTLLLVAAAEDSGELATVLSAAAQLGAASQALDAAEREGLARVRGDQLEFHHPLVRSAVYHSAPLSRRHDVHRALASVLNGESEADRRAWHHAAATVGPDPAVANELDQAAQRARKRSGFAAASLAFERAAALTSNERQRVASSDRGGGERVVRGPSRAGGDVAHASPAARFGANPARRHRPLSRFDRDERRQSPPTPVSFSFVLRLRSRRSMASVRCSCSSLPASLRPGQMTVRRLLRSPSSLKASPWIPRSAVCLLPF